VFDLYSAHSEPIVTALGQAHKIENDSYFNEMMNLFAVFFLVTLKISYLADSLQG